MKQCGMGLFCKQLGPHADIKKMKTTTSQNNESVHMAAEIEQHALTLRSGNAGAIIKRCMVYNTAQSPKAKTAMHSHLV